MMNHIELGRLGEKLACFYLKRKGYRIIGRNIRFHKEEIDILALYNKQLVVVEVKTRRTRRFGKPAEAVNYYKQKHIRNVTNYVWNYYIPIYNAKIVRFDIIEVTADEGLYAINHIENCF